MQTRQSITAALRPFVGARLRGEHRNTSVDLILTYGSSCNVDIRGLSDEGVECFFYRDIETTPWGKIVAVRLRGLDEQGMQISERLIERDAPAERIAA